jgi:hypothetical protein
MVTMNPLRHIFEDQLTSAPSPGDQWHDMPDEDDEAALVAGQLEDLETELLVLADRVGRLHGELTAAIGEARRDRLPAAA